jgi:flagellar biosynthesis/type III secretory pathway protein FliH
MSEIKDKLDQELKTVNALCETMEHAIKSALDKGIDNVDTHEMYEAVDIFKDLSEVKKNIVEVCYKKQIMEAMEEYGDEETEDEDVRFYRGQPRSKTSGRYMSRGDGRRNYTFPEMERMEYYRDMDRRDGRMYYSGTSSSNMSSEGSSRNYNEGYSEGNSRGYNEGYNRGYEEGSRSNSRRDSREGRSGQSRRMYIESKNTADKDTKMRDLEKYMNELNTDITEMMSGASAEEKTMLKNKLQTIMSKM